MGRLQAKGGSALLATGVLSTPLPYHPAMPPLFYKQKTHAGFAKAEATGAVWAPRCCCCGMAASAGQPLGLALQAPRAELAAAGRAAPAALLECQSLHKNRMQACCHVK